MTGTFTSPSSAALKRTRELILPGLRAAVDALHPRLATACGYHLGWCAADGTPATGTAQGKFVRATLVLLSAEAAGGRAEAAVPGAVAVELIHNHSMLHDDVIDADDLRRGRRTAWLAYGTGTAILAGDALAAAAIVQLAAIGTDPGRRALQLLADGLRRLCDGQAADVELEEGTAFTVEDYLRMAADKTSALLAAAAGIGAVLAEADEATVQCLQDACHDLGLAWQAANDVEDIWGPPAVTGKPPLSDLRQGKTTLPVLAALLSNTAAGRELAALRAVQGSRDDETLERIAELIVRAGGRAVAERLARDKLAAALARLDHLAAPVSSRQALASLFRFAVTRQA
ncbi:polyprenyl synthetase family protein [Nonomuraea sp. NPDC050783]|uniref:polyprenyl synthetase family protein n=1 Tax=Nonomuraea sp. NPDC050783 TaxID=3154634 RepID=UPI00346633DA